MPVLAVDPSTATVITAIAALAVAAVLAVWLIPLRQRKRWHRAGVEGRELAELENSARSTLVQLLGGVALILTFVATWLQIADTRTATDRTLELTAEQQESERFTQAVQQLDSSRPAVRLGGIYGLQRAARDTPSRRTVAQIMVAYLRSNHPLRRDDRRLAALDLRNRFAGHRRVYPGACRGSHSPPWPDTQAAVSVLLGLPRQARPQMDLSGVDLVGVRVSGADFSNAILRGASLAGAKLPGANFDGALLAMADLRRTCLRRARFNRTAFGYPDMTGADLSGADLSNADLSERGSFRVVTDACTRLPGRRVRADCHKP